MVKETLNPLTDGELRKFVNVCSKGLTMLLSNLESGRREETFPVFTDCLRSIRNISCTNQNMQSLFARHDFLWNHVSRFVSLMPPDLVKTEPERVSYRCLIQAVANMTVKNPSNQLDLISDHRWQIILQKMFLVDDLKCGEYLSMLLSTCFSSPKVVEALINDKSHASFISGCVSGLTSVFEEKDALGAVFAVQKLWNANNFARFLREHAVERAVRSVLYQILGLKLGESNESSEYSDDDFSNGFRGNIVLLAEVFNVEASRVFSTTSAERPQHVNHVHAAGHFSELLDVLCVASSSPALLLELQTSLELVMSVTTILIQIVALSRLTTSSSSSTSSSSTTDDSRLHFHRDVVRLLGNLCWKHRRNQDAVRDLNGVPAVLNSFNIDESSPFVRQWAVFALRNLCEDNLENQEVVAGIQLRGVEDRGGVLEEMGLEIELDGGKPRLRKRD